MNNQDDEEQKEEKEQKESSFIQKYGKKMTIIENLLKEQKKITKELEKEMEWFSKYKNKLIEKEQNKKEQKKQNALKPRGFACPCNVSDKLCIFMGKPLGTRISRTEATKFINLYIKENNMKDPEKKSRILPNENFIHLFGEDMKTDENITSFTIQKYMNRLFIHSK